VPRFSGVDSEVGRLRAVIVHRPGAELKRERIGIEVITVPGSELCGSRGGPRSLCCPVSRDPAPLPGDLCTEL
jgi:arginine deiminase